MHWTGRRIIPRRSLWRAGTSLLLLALLPATLVMACRGQDDRITSPPLLRDHPDANIPGRIAYVSGQRSRFDSCITVLPASGVAQANVVNCDYPAQSQLVWLDESRLGLLDYAGWGHDWIDNGVILHEPSQGIQALDVASGVITRTSMQGYIQGWGSETVIDLDVRGRSISARGEVAHIDERGRLFIDSREVAQFEGTKGRLHVALWSPDAEWLLLDFEGSASDELWIVSRNGSVSGTLVTDLKGDVTWIIAGVGITPRLVHSTPAASAPTPTVGPR